MTATTTESRVASARALATVTEGAARRQRPIRGDGARGRIVGALVAVAVVSVSGLGCREETVHRVWLDFTPKSGGVRGFTCVAPRSETPMAARIVQHGKVSLVVDAIPTPGLTRCRYVDLLDHCAATGCEPAPALRTCVDVDVDLSAATRDNLTEIASEALRSLEGRDALAGAIPDAPLIVRVVGMAASCAETEGTPALDATRVFGCATSCPLVLTGTDVDVKLDLDANDDDCATAVVACTTGVMPTRSEGASP